ncbi:MAG: hypothetical protein GY943_13925 [Chloroflexi bacterium]|nr:hypothetical protein [Chloroflexota bacterium]
MSKETIKKIGLIVGDEKEWPAAFVAAINEKEGYAAELIKLSGTFMGDSVDYDVIIDRISHEIPYYRAFLKYAVIQGVHVINNPFTWSADSKFYGAALINKLGLTSPRTAVLPNKDVVMDARPNTFRNLKYPMDWNAIIDYVGVPAIFKDIHSGGRRPVYRVSNVDDLLMRYDQSGTRTKILQQIIESDTHIHCIVIGQENVLALRYSWADGHYLPEILTENDPIGQKVCSHALTITKAYQYDINMVEFVIKDDEIYVINSTNPAPVIDTDLMTPEQFTWCVSKSAKIAMKRAQEPTAQHVLSLSAQIEVDQ